MDKFTETMGLVAKGLDAHASAMKEERKAINDQAAEQRKDREEFARHTKNLLRGMASLGIVLAGTSAIIVWRLDVATDAAETAAANASRTVAALEAIDVGVQGAREEAREAREAVAEAPRLEVVAPSPGASASAPPRLVLVAPVSRPPQARAGAPVPAPSASVPLAVDVVPSTSTGSP